MKRPETRIIHTRGARLGSVTVNPPVERASTVLFRTEEALYESKPGYGRMGLGVHRELEAASASLKAPAMCAWLRMVFRPVRWPSRHAWMRAATS